MTKEVVIEAVRQQVREAGLDLASPQEFPNLLEVAATALRAANADSLEPACLRTLTAMGALGPRIGLPEDELCDTLCALVEAHCEPQDHEALLDLVLAFGCGWRRGLGAAGTGWSGLWTPSFRGLEKRVLAICGTVYRALTEKLHVRFPAEDDPAPLLPHTATVLVTMLIQPVAPVAINRLLIVSAGNTDGDRIFAGLTIRTDAGWEEEVPTGARAVYQCVNGDAQDASQGIGFAAGDVIRMVSSETVSNLQVWSRDAETKKHEKKPTAGSEIEFSGSVDLHVHACTCGRKDCADRHHLSAWNPSDKFGKLQHFLYNAIRGKMQSLKAKDFAQSLLGSAWSRNGWGGGPRLRMAETIEQVNVGTNKALIAHDRLIAVDTAQSIWELREYWRCGTANCEVPDLPGEGKTIIDAEDSIGRHVGTCVHCGNAFWSADRALTINQHFADAKTLLAGARGLEKSRRSEACQSCGAPGRTPNYCWVCEKSGRRCELPSRPSWYFTSGRTMHTVDETESEEDRLLREESAYIETGDS